MITCRYCSMYCPGATTPIYGHCVAVTPPRAQDLRNLNPVLDCPFSGNEWEISKVANRRGFEGRDLARMEYYGVDAEGIRTRYYPTLDALKEGIARSGGGYYRYIVAYIDKDRRVISTERLPDG